MENELLLSMPEVASALRISKASTWRRVHDGSFGPEIIRLGGNARVRAEELRDWVRAGCPPRRRWCWPGENRVPNLAGASHA